MIHQIYNQFICMITTLVKKLKESSSSVRNYTRTYHMPTNKQL